MLHHFIHQVRIETSLDAFRANRRRRHDVAGKFLRSQRWIEIAVIVAIIATVVATPFAQHTIQRTAPIRLAHSSNVESRVVAPIEIQMSVVDIVNDVSIVIKQRATLAT